MKASKRSILPLLTSAIAAPFYVLLAVFFAAPSVLAAPGGSWAKTDKLESVQTKINAKQYQAAINELEVLVAKDENNADAFNLLGFSNRKLGRYVVSEKYYLKALELKPKHKGALEYVGELYVETGRMGEAEKILTRLDEACFLPCDEYKQLKKIIENKLGQQKVSQSNF